MAKKEPETVERFRVWAEIPKQQLGDIVAMFTKMGLEHIGHELITDVMTFKQSRKFDATGPEFLREWIAEHPTFTAKEVRAHFEAGGRNKDSAYAALYKLTNEKLIKKLSESNYQRADVKAIAPPKKAKAKKAAVRLGKKTGKPLGNTAKRYDVPNHDFVLRLLGKRKSMTLAQLIEAFESGGRMPQSVSPVLDKLLHTHKVKRIAQGEYAINKRKLTPRVAASKLNGAAPHTEVEANA